MTLSGLAPYLGIIEIILAVVMTVLVLIQSKGSNLGGFLGGSSDSGGSFRTRRGIEATIHRITIICAVLFFVNTVLAFLAWG
ncbi:MAG: preprotein translocase subunit SecG [Anaerolineae bacterium]|nr:preprotein translocase subunit SecG [Anaerolineae bacterium]